MEINKIEEKKIKNKNLMLNLTLTKQNKKKTYFITVSNLCVSSLPFCYFYLSFSPLIYIFFCIQNYSFDLKPVTLNYV